MHPFEKGYEGKIFLDSSVMKDGRKKHEIAIKNVFKMLCTIITFAQYFKHFWLTLNEY